MVDETQASVPGHAQLSASRIVGAAARLIDTEGEAHLTMRRLGAALHVKAMSIYRYFPSRRTLLDTVAETVASQAAVSLWTQSSPGNDWRAYLSDLSHGFRQLATNHPRLFLLIATHPTAAPWLRPPMCSLRLVDTFVQRLQEDHFSPPAVAAAYKQFCAFLLGHLLPEATTGSLNRSPADLSSPVLGDGEQTTNPRVCNAARSTALGGDLTGCPHVGAVAGLLAADTFTTDFNRDLGQLLDQLAGR